ELPGWYAHHLTLDPTAGSYLRDVEFAATAVTDADAGAAEHGLTCPGIANEVRLALLSASLRSSLRRVGSRLLAVLLEEGVLSPSRALMVARQSPDASGKSRIIAILGPLAALVFEEALAVTRSIDDGVQKVAALLALRMAAAPDRRPSLLDE